jgi:flagellar export protein FliJ
MYKFPLQRVLEIRIQKEDEVFQQKEQVDRSLTLLKSILQEELQSYFDERNTFNESLALGKVLTLPLLEQGLECRKKRLVEILARVRAAEADLAELNGLLVEARKDVKAVEKLREHREAEFWEREASKERKMLDELAVSQHSRKERNSA